ncbi:phage tail tube protein [Rhizobium mongolense]|uniref:Secreted protein n=2 Tax=Rhizobium mongolense TaxID=57676 RepID=A0ABR6IVY1_9HYPH|nr:phage tail tube protein [Rhizobium mongolense]MBB4232076.1 putative secreted protein [Rhizobium mongolense]TVZ63947.1 phage tail tube protein [Rhizobium mongolense USDA 1844]
MAKPTTARFGKFSVKLGNDADPIIYAAPCGFTSKSLQLTKDLTDVNIPDCDDPDAVAWVGRDAASLSAAITGEGVAAAESAETWLDAWENVDSVPVKVEIFFPAKTITWTGRMHVSELTIGAEQGGRVTMNVSLQSDGELVRTVSAGS